MTVTKAGVYAGLLPGHLDTPPHHRLLGKHWHLPGWASHPPAGSGPEQQGSPHTPRCQHTSPRSFSTPRPLAPSFSSSRTDSSKLRSAGSSQEHASQVVHREKIARWSDSEGPASILWGEGKAWAPGGPGVGLA